MDERSESHCYLDDLTELVEDRQQAVRLCEAATSVFQWMGLQVNAEKTVISEVRHHCNVQEVEDVVDERNEQDEVAATVDVMGWQVPIGTRTELLGADLALVEQKQGLAPRGQKRLGKAVHRSQRLRNVPGSDRWRAEVAATAVAGLHEWMPLGEVPTLAQDMKAREEVLVGIPGHGRRAQETSREVCLAALHKGHRLDPLWIRTHKLLVLLRCSLRSGDAVSRACHDRLTEEDEEWRLYPGSLTHAVCEHLARWNVVIRGSFISHGDSTLDCLVGVHDSEFGHQLRSFFKQRLFANLCARRPREFAGLVAGVAKRFHSGGFITRERMYRHRGKKEQGGTPYCHYCGVPTYETVEHLLRDCPRFDCGHRQDMRSLVEQGRIGECIFRVGLLSSATQLTKAEWAQVHAFQRKAYYHLQCRDRDLSMVDAEEHVDQMLPRRCSMGALAETSACA
eukprot:3969539-Amphidinium_carterae.2